MGSLSESAIELARKIHDKTPSQGSHGQVRYVELTEAETSLLMIALGITTVFLAEAGGEVQRG